MWLCSFGSFKLGFVERLWAPEEHPDSSLAEASRKRSSCCLGALAALCADPGREVKFFSLPISFFIFFIFFHGFLTFLECFFYDFSMIFHDFS